MEKLRHPRKESSPRQRPPVGATEAAPSGSGAVRVEWGSMSESFDLAGMSVEDAQRVLQRPYNLAPDVRVTVNGAPPSAGQQLREGDHLEFVRLAGEKGGAP